MNDTQQRRKRNTTSWKSAAAALRIDLDIARKRIIDLEIENLNLRVDLDNAKNKAETILNDRTTLAKELLVRAMREIAERHFGMPVFIGIGQALWSDAHAKEPVALNRHEAILLKKLSSWSGGWWTLEPGDTEMKFVDIDRWVKDYEQYSRKPGESAT